MNRLDPDWHADLRGEPLRAKMFTPELAARIRAQAEAESVRSARTTNASTRRALYIGAAASCLAVILLLALQQDRVTLLEQIVVGDSSVQPGEPVSAAGGGQDAAITGSATGTEARSETGEDGATPEEPSSAGSDGAGQPAEPGQPAEAADPGAVEPDATSEPDAADKAGKTDDAARAAPDDSRFRYPVGSKYPRLMVKEPNREDWQLLVDLTHPNRQYEVIFEDFVDDRRWLIVSRVMTEKGDELRGRLMVDEMAWELDGWQWSGSLEFESGSLRNSDKRVIASWMGFGPKESAIEIFMGFLLDPDIVRIRVTDHRDDVHEAKLFPDARGVTLWYARTPEQPYHSDYVVEGWDAEGNMVYSKPLKDHALHVGHKENPDAEAQP